MDEAVLVMDRAKAREMYHRILTTVSEDAPCSSSTTPVPLVASNDGVTPLTKCCVAPSPSRVAYPHMAPGGDVAARAAEPVESTP